MVKNTFKIKKSNFTYRCSMNVEHLGDKKDLYPVITFVNCGDYCTFLWFNYYIENYKNTIKYINKINNKNN